MRTAAPKLNGTRMEISSEARTGVFLLLTSFGASVHGIFPF